MNKSETEFLIHLLNFTEVMLRYGVEDITGKANQLSLLLTESMKSYLNTFAPDDRVKLLKRVKKLSEARVLEFAEYDKQYPKDPTRARYNNEKMILSLFFYVQGLLNRGMLTLSDDAPITLAVDYLGSIIDIRWQMAEESNDTNTIFVIQSRIEKAKKISDRWLNEL